MPGISFLLKGQPCHLDFAGEYQPGDQPPSGYPDQYEWAMVQEKAGLRQRRCCQCAKFKYPQELSHIRNVSYASRTKRGPANVRIEGALCNNCHNLGVNP